MRRDASPSLASNRSLAKLLEDTFDRDYHSATQVPPFSTLHSILVSTSVPRTVSLGEGFADQPDELYERWKVGGR